VLIETLTGEGPFVRIAGDRLAIASPDATRIRTLDAGDAWNLVTVIPHPVDQFPRGVAIDGDRLVIDHISITRAFTRDPATGQYTLLAEFPNSAGLRTCDLEGDRIVIGSRTFFSVHRFVGNTLEWEGDFQLCDDLAPSYRPFSLDGGGVAIPARGFGALIFRPSAGSWGSPCIGLFTRGDANGDGAVSLGDAIAALGYLFQGMPAGCVVALDANDDDAVSLGDPIWILLHLFGGAGPLPPPHTCGFDGTPGTLGCESGCGIVVVDFPAP